MYRSIVDPTYLETVNITSHVTQETSPDEIQANVQSDSGPSEAEIQARCPIIYFHSDEQYFPASVEFYLEHMYSDGEHMFPKSRGSDGDWISEGQQAEWGLSGFANKPPGSDLDFLYGQDPRRQPVPIYALRVPKTNGMWDVVYWMFYPYNQGKAVCIGRLQSVPVGVRMCQPDLEDEDDEGGFMGFIKKTAQKILPPYPCGVEMEDKCLGVGYVTFGNHFGDWEHSTARWSLGECQTVYLSAHDSGGEFPVNSDKFEREGTRPVYYAARGSHGLYTTAGDHQYFFIKPLNFPLIDYTNKGIRWDPQLVIIPYRPPGQYEGEFEWMNYMGRWGTDGYGCGLIEQIAGECILNEGPTGPVDKGASEPSRLDFS